MGQQIIQQPNGKFCLFDSITDTFVLMDYTGSEMVEYIADEAKCRAKKQAQQLIDSIERKEKPYYQFTMTFSQAAKKHLKNEVNCGSPEFVKGVRILIEELKRK